MKFRKAAFFILAAMLGLHGPASAVNLLNEIEIKIDGINSIAHLQFSEKVAYSEALLLENPYRLLIYFKGQKVYCSKANASIDKGIIKEVRYVYKESNLKAKPLEYIVLYFEKKASLDIEKKKKVLTFILRTAQIKDIETTYMTTPSSQKPRDLASCIQIALAANPQVRIAADEVRLADIKAWEALRALYPGLTAKYEQTRGDAVRETGVPDFDEKSFGIQMSQALYQGGKLKATYKQAKLSKDIARIKYEELSGKIIFEAIKAYYDYLKAVKAYDAYKELSDDVAKDINSSRKRYKAELSTKIEFFTVENQQNQVAYSKLSHEKDLELAKLNLTQILFLPKKTEFDVDPIIPYGNIEADLEETVRFAVLHQPALNIAQLEFELHEAGKVIAGSANAFKIELSGFAGRSGGAYKTENLEMGEDYSAGVKLSKPFGGNTMNSSFLFDKTSPKLGQSSRTQSKSGSVSLSLFDNIKGYGEALEGDINYNQSKLKLIEMRTQLEQAVCESLFNVQKGFLQVGIHENEVSLAKSEVAAVQSKKEHNLAQISELIGAKIKLAEAHKAYYEALSFFNVSLASLNKAVGKSDKFTITQTK
ncbi:MAG: TolC family protein [bacterium]